MEKKRPSLFEAGSKALTLLVLTTGCTNSDMIAPVVGVDEQTTGPRSTEQVIDELVLKIDIDESANNHIDWSGKINLKKLIKEMAKRMGVAGEVNVQAIGSNIGQEEFSQLYRNFYGSKKSEEEILEMYGYIQDGDVRGMHLNVDGANNIFVVVDDDSTEDSFDPGMELIIRVGTELRHVITGAQGTCAVQDLSDMVWAESVVIGMDLNEKGLAYSPEMLKIGEISVMCKGIETQTDPFSEAITFGWENADLLGPARGVYK